MKVTCPIGYTCPDLSSTTDDLFDGTIPCNIGFYGSATDTCTLCPIGSFCDQPGMVFAELKTCGDGSYCNEGKIITIIPRYKDISKKMHFRC